MRAKLINHYFPLIVRKGIKIYDGLLWLYKLYDVLKLYEFKGIVQIVYPIFYNQLFLKGTEYN